MALKTVSDVLAARLFNVLHTIISHNQERHSYDVRKPWATVFRRHFVEVLGGFSDDFDLNSSKLIKTYKAIFSSKDYLRILGTT